ncbi:MAG: dephospho-CoA kinase [Omnitrophica WOR_2 bacterium GWF2_38_59]|nr:MAG: dephospho-CoA kinase [Omnitrophica WOR_2 bacterium GWA2_37_7]OGX26612.1 MAG: dephospho-CoA kinase [Omnitrophica WOR_2 bacterium GWF2_38_59]OGX47737.1 MAG: dephospho-CoA kinase [Omnitrophica WOR_2 bacterium RIFOXYA2_FULL_38_17]OGX50427.1 MAG: dephospho-CoA kinase [Omnitrophica WOR_2 bacterium RIFOXYA12_FULL_38_10]OGX55776.1 MAG: dephospho-CoA kinase [Omnitrophica WOR_2 bacterium RIFOXYB2_FULL_38_16]OGX57731.1 MAG: dephospho-CoA kinase [Omnitrophica WOR_2 bacterium RIFOXYC2_FULL_38_12]H
MVILGVTGSLSTGKTSVSKSFQELGAKVLDADKIAHDQMKKGGICYDRIIKVFGKAIVDGDEINRKKLADIVFSDKEKLDKLVAIIHPAVKNAIGEEIRRYNKRKKEYLVVVDVPLLFESNLHRYVDWIIVVKAKRQQQIERAVEKFKISKQQAIRRIKMQMPLREKIRLADIIIDNSRSLIETKEQVKEIWQKILLKKKK